MPDRDWRFRVEDIIRAIEKTGSYAGGADYEAFTNNTMAVDAVIRNLEVIGEAARNIPAEIAARHPEIGWPEMRAIRNILIHEYFGVDLSIVWQTVKHDLPPLLPKLRALLQTGK